MDLKITISRSYARKVSKDYQTKDYFASYSQEVPEDSDPTNILVLSDNLYHLAKEDVEKAIAEDSNTGDGIPDDEFSDMLVSLANHGTVNVERFQLLNDKQQKTMQDLKRSYKRRDYKASK